MLCCLLYCQRKHEGAYETEDGVELRKSGIDERVGLDVMSLADANDTICADLSLTDGGEKTHKSHSKTDAEEYRTISDKVEFVHQEPHEETHEAVDTLGGREGRQDKVTAGFFRSHFKSTFCSVSCYSGADCASDTGETKHESESEIT